MKVWYNKKKVFGIFGGAKMAKKYYAVKKGKKTGIFLSWDECKENVTGVSGAEYKSFSSKIEAEQYMNEIKAFEDEEGYDVIAYVDGSYEKNINKYAYGCVILWKGQQVELSGNGNEKELLTMNNVAGELMGSMEAIKWAIQKKATSIVIYHDYEGIAKWANDVWKANKIGTKKYKEFIANSRKKLKIDFVKVRAHTGVEWNERADELAKKALSANDTSNKEEMLFRKHMEIGIDKEKDNGSIIINSLVISENRMKKYIKDLWKSSGNKIGEIGQLAYQLNLDNKRLYVKIVTKDEKVHQIDIPLDNVI